MIPSDIKTYVAWKFDEVLPGTFKRNKGDCKDTEFPIIGPLPTDKASTRPKQGLKASGPFVYFVVNSKDEVCYIGKTTAVNVVKQWVRPDNGVPPSHYWSHISCVQGIANGIKGGEGPFELRFISVRDIPSKYTELYSEKYPEKNTADQAKYGFIDDMSPLWKS